MQPNTAIQAADNQSLRVTSSVRALFVFHLSNGDDENIAICGEHTEPSDVPLASYGTSGDGIALHYRYCARCARRSAGALRIAGVRVEIPPPDDVALAKKFATLSGKPIDTSQKMAVDWHEEIRLTALRAKARLRANDTPELRAQIFEFVTGDVAAMIFANVFADDPDFVEKCKAYFALCHEPNFL